MCRRPNIRWPPAMAMPCRINLVRRAWWGSRDQRSVGLSHSLQYRARQILSLCVRFSRVYPVFVEFGLPPDFCDVDLQQMNSSSLTNNDISISLLNVPFSRRSDTERNEILKRGRPTPKLSISKKYKKRSRSFQSSWYGQHKWLCGNGEKSKLFYWSCLLLGTKKTMVC